MSRQQIDNDDTPIEGACAFERVLFQCRPELMAYLRSRIRNADDAEDLAQETCTRLLQYRHDPLIDDMRAMLFRIANNVLIDHYRRSDRRSANDHVDIEQVESLEAPEPAHVDRIARREALARLSRAIERLPPKRQMVFILSRIEGLSHKQIADKMGISVKMVEKHITKALVACQSGVGDLDA